MSFNRWWNEHGKAQRGDRIALALEAWSAALRAGRCANGGHVWVGIGEEGRVVCDDCGIDKSLSSTAAASECETPRTDAALLDAKLTHSFPNASFVHADVARKLERELASAKRDADHFFKAHGRALEELAAKEAQSSIERNFSLRHLQKHLPWTIPYSAEFEASAGANGLRRVGHDVLHVMKSLGRIAAEVEAADHNLPRKLTGSALAKEVADLVLCALHIARCEGFDLEEAVVTNSEARNAASIPPEPVSWLVEACKHGVRWPNDCSDCEHELSQRLAPSATGGKPNA